MLFEIEIDGEKVSLKEGDFKINDAQIEAPEAAAKIFYWGSVAAAARQQLEAARSTYRNETAKSLVASLTADPKLAEWKAKAAWEASEKFKYLKEMIEHWIKVYDQASAAYEACKSRASTIQTIYNHEMGGRSLANSLGSDPQDKKAKVREIMRKRR